MPVDDEGLSVKEGRRLAPDARVAFVTPSRQLPLGVTMSLPRRMALLDWAAEAGQLFSLPPSHSAACFDYHISQPLKSRRMFISNC